MTNSYYFCGKVMNSCWSWENLIIIFFFFNFQYWSHLVCKSYPSSARVHWRKLAPENQWPGLEEEFGVSHPKLRRALFQNSILREILAPFSLWAGSGVGKSNTGISADVCSWFFHMWCSNLFILLGILLDVFQVLLSLCTLLWKYVYFVLVILQDWVCLYMQHCI